MVLRDLHPARSIRARLFFLHVFIVAPLLVLGLLWIGDSAMGDRERLVAKIEDRADRVSFAVAAIVQEETTVLRTVAELPTIELGELAGVDSLLSSLLGHHPFENNFYLIDASGVRVASAVSGTASHELMGENELFREVMVTGQPFVGAARIAQEGRVAGQPVVPVAVPVRSQAGRLTGVLVGELVLSELQRLTGLTRDPASGYVYIVDRIGQVVAHPNMEYALSLRDFSQVPAVRHLQEGEEDVSEFVDPIDNTSMLGAYKKVGGTGWGVVSVMPSAVVSQTMVQEGFGILAVLGVSLGLAVVAAYLVGNGIANRIAEVAAAASAVVAGEAGRPAMAVGRDEIGVIAQSLNGISTMLREQLEKLESVSQTLKSSCEDVGVALASGLDVEESLRLAMQSAARLVGAEAAVGLLSENGEGFRIARLLGPIPPQIMGQPWSVDERSSVLGATIRERRPQQIKDLLAAEAPPDPLVLLARREGYRAVLVMPMVSYSRCLGALVLFDIRRSREFTMDEISGVQTIAGEAAVAIDTARLQEQIKLANERLTVASLRLRTIVESIPEGVVVAEAPDGRIAMANSEAERLLGKKIDPDADLHEQPRVYNFFTIEGRVYGAEDQPLYRSIVGGEVDTSEIVIRRPDGKEITVLFSSSPMRDMEAKVVGAVGVFRDISAMKELDRLKDEFISVTSHELKSPLTVVKGYAQLLLKRLRAMPEQADEVKWLEAITDQSMRLSGLVDRLLDVSRLQSGRLELLRGPVDIVTLACDVAEHEQVTTALHQIRVNAKMPDLVGNWDRARLEQVLMNLIDNAIKYSPRGGPIDIHIQQVGDEAQVGVQDRGLGIAKEEQRRVFERFYRAQQTGERPPYLGLGLYVSYQIVALHGGRMWVESEEGKGSAFYFTLPLERRGPS